MIPTISMIAIQSCPLASRPAEKSVSGAGNGQTDGQIAEPD